MRDGRYLPIISSNGSKLNISKKARRGKVSVPAPAVIAALLAYIDVDAVKKLVVGVVWVFRGENTELTAMLVWNPPNSLDYESAGFRP
jgi:hypothetical protein